MKILKIIKDGIKIRVINNYRTTIIGLILLIVGIGGLLLGKIEFGEFSSFIGTIIVLFYVQDSFLNINPEINNCNEKKDEDKIG